MEGTSTQVMDIGTRQSTPFIATVHTARMGGEESDQIVQSDVLVSAVVGWQEDEPEGDGNFTIQAPITMLRTF
jgi:hypothetical protein